MQQNLKFLHLQKYLSHAFVKNFNPTLDPIITAANIIEFSNTPIKDIPSLGVNRRTMNSDCRDPYFTRYFYAAENPRHRLSEIPPPHAASTRRNPNYQLREYKNSYAIPTARACSAVATNQSLQERPMPSQRTPSTDPPAAVSHDDGTSISESAYVPSALKQQVSRMNTAIERTALEFENLPISSFTSPNRSADDEVTFENNSTVGPNMSEDLGRINSRNTIHNDQRPSSIFDEEPLINESRPREPEEHIENDESIDDDNDENHIIADNFVENDLPSGAVISQRQNAPAEERPFATSKRNPENDRENTEANHTANSSASPPPGDHNERQAGARQPTSHEDQTNRDSRTRDQRQPPHDFSFYDEESSSDDDSSIDDDTHYSASTYSHLSYAQDNNPTTPARSTTHYRDNTTHTTRDAAALTKSLLKSATQQSMPRLTLRM